MEKFLVSMGKAVVIKVASTLAIRGTHYVVNWASKRKVKKNEQSTPELES